MNQKFYRLTVFFLCFVASFPTWSMHNQNVHANARGQVSRDDFRASHDAAIAETMNNGPQGRAPVATPAPRPGIVARLRQRVSAVAGWFSSWRYGSGPRDRMNDDYQDAENPPVAQIDTVPSPVTPEPMPMAGEDIRNAEDLGQYYDALVERQGEEEVSVSTFGGIDSTGRELTNNGAGLRRGQEMNLAFSIPAQPPAAASFGVFSLHSDASIPDDAGPLFEESDSIEQTLENASLAFRLIREMNQDLLNALGQIDLNQLYSGERLLVESMIEVLPGSAVAPNESLAESFANSHPSSLQAYLLFEMVSQHLSDARSMHQAFRRDRDFQSLGQRLGFEWIVTSYERQAAAFSQVLMALYKPARAARRAVGFDLSMPDIGFIDSRVRREVSRLVRDSMRRPRQVLEGSNAEVVDATYAAQAEDGPSANAGAVISLEPAPQRDKGDAKGDDNDNKDDEHEDDAQETPATIIDDAPKPRKEKRGGSRKERQQARRQTQAQAQEARAARDREASAMSLQPSEGTERAVYLTEAQRVELFQSLTDEELAELQRFFGIDGNYDGDNNHYYTRSTILNVAQIVVPILRKMGFSTAAIRVFEEEFNNRADHYPHRRRGTYPEHYVDVSRGAWVVRGVRFPTGAWTTRSGQRHAGWLPKTHEDRANQKMYELANALGGM